MKDSNNKGAEHYKARKVVCVNSMKLYGTVKEASEDVEYFNASESAISRCCAGELPSAGKWLVGGERLQWAYLEDFIECAIPCIKAEMKNWIFCFNNNRIYTSSKEACEELNLLPVRVSMHLKGDRPSAGFMGASTEKIILKRFRDLV